MSLTPEQIAQGWKLHDGSDVNPIKDPRTVYDVQTDWGQVIRNQTGNQSWYWHRLSAYRIIEAHGADAAPARPSENSESDYQLGYRDGYETAVQECDILTGGDGEYFASTLGSDCRTPDQMKRRMEERWQAHHSRPTPYPADYSELVWDPDGWSQTIIVDGKRPEWLRDDDVCTRHVGGSGTWPSPAHLADAQSIRVRRREPKRETRRCHILSDQREPGFFYIPATIDLIDGQPDLSTLKIGENL